FCTSSSLGSSFTIFLLPFPEPAFPLNLSFPPLVEVVFPFPEPGAPALLILRRFFLLAVDLSSFFLSSVFFFGLLICDNSILSLAILGPESFWYCLFNFSSATGASSLAVSFFGVSFFGASTSGFSAVFSTPFS